MKNKSLWQTGVKGGRGGKHSLWEQGMIIAKFEMNETKTNDLNGGYKHEFSKYAYVSHS